MENYQTLLISITILVCVLSTFIFTWKLRTYDKEWNRKKMVVEMEKQRDKIVKEFEEVERNNLALLAEKEKKVNNVVERFILENKKLQEENESLKNIIGNMEKENEEIKIEFEEGQ